jgi:hypothetical protein
MDRGTHEQQRDDVGNTGRIPHKDLTQDTQLPRQPQAKYEGTGEDEPLEEKLMSFSRVDHELYASDRVMFCDSAFSRTIACSLPQIFVMELQIGN